MSDLREMFTTKNGGVYQSDSEKCFYINFAGHTSRFKTHHYFNLKRQIDKIDLVSLLLNSEKSADMEIVSICGTDRCFALNIKEVIEFKELLNGAKAMLELNSILRERIFTHLA